jgi:RNA polymerase sigma-70 factor (ECF subfamily)
MDMVLLRRWQSERDGQAFAELVARYSGMVYSVCRRITLDESRAEDLAQDCFMKLADARPKVDHSLGPWLHRVATNVAISEVRSHSRRVKREKNYSAQTPDLAEPTWDDIQEYVDEAVNGLAEEQRASIVLHFFEGKTQEAVAEQLGVPRSTAASRIKRGVDEVRKALKRRGVVVPVATLTTLFAEMESSAAPLSLTTSLGKAALSGRLGQVATSGIYWTSYVPMAALVLVIVGVGVGLLREFVLDSESVVGEDAVSNTAADASVAIGGGASVEGANAQISNVQPETNADNSTAVNGIQITDVLDRISEALEEPSGGSISGRVYDEVTGAGIEGAQLYSTPMPRENGRQIHYKSGPDGRYSFSGLADGFYEITKSHVPGYPRAYSYQQVSVTIKDAEVLTGIDFAVSPGTRVAGRVLDANGDPASGVRVAAMTAESPAAERTDTANDGRFEIYLPQGEGDVFALAYTDEFASLLWGPEKIQTPTTESIELRLTFPRNATVSGTVVNASGIPISGARVRPRLLPVDEKLYNVDSLLRHTGDPKTDDSGHFTASVSLPVGTGSYSALRMSAAGARSMKSRA